MSQSARRNVPACCSVAERIRQLNHPFHIMSASLSIPFKIVVLIMLCIVTIWFFNGYPRYQVIGGELLRNPELAANLADWGGANAHAEPLAEGGVRLRAQGNDFVQVAQAVERSASLNLLRLNCSIKTQHVVNGPRAWDRARVLLLSYDAGGKPMYNRPHLLAKRDGSQEWEAVDKVFALAADVAKVEVAVQMSHASGELWVKSCSLRPVMLKSAFKQYRLALLWAWGFTALWIAWPFLRASVKSPAHAGVVLLALGIFFGVLTPEQIKEAIGVAIWPTTERNFDANLGTEFNDEQSFGLELKLPNPDIFKVGHFVMFGLLSMVLAAGKAYRMPTVRLLFYLLLMALVSEVLQLFMPGRGPQLGDIAVDGAGVLTGLLLWQGWRCCKRFAAG